MPIREGSTDGGKGEGGTRGASSLEASPAARQARCAIQAQPQSKLARSFACRKAGSLRDSIASGAAASKDAEAAAAEKAAETAEKSAESGGKAEAAAAEKSDGNLPFTVKDGRVAIASKARAGKKIIAKTGEVIEFDKDGKASVRAEDAAYLSACGGFEFE